jgi:hypothetical protein
MERFCKQCERLQRDQYCEVCGVWTCTEEEELEEALAADRQEGRRWSDLIQLLQN